MGDEDDDATERLGRENVRGVAMELGAGGLGGGAAAGSGSTFNHERLEVFRFAREAFRITASWKSRKMPAVLRDQFERSTVSIVSNIAEGAAKLSKPDKRRSYAIAKGSTNEAGAQLEMLHLLGVIDATEYSTVRELFLKIAKMLHGLCGERRTT